MAAAPPRFHQLRVQDVAREGADAVSIGFAVPDLFAADYAFDAGQYLTLRAVIDGVEQRRSYSICSSPDEGTLRIGVKRVEGGAFSAWLNTQVAAGALLDVMTPTGRFGLQGVHTDGRVHVGFAAGSGITPILSILQAVLAREPASRFFLFYGSRSTATILFRAQLERLKDRFMQRLSVFHVLSREQQDVPVLHGRLDGAKVRLLLRAMVPAASIDQVFLCGPLGMIDELQAVLQAEGVDPARIHAERFVSAYQGAPRVSVTPPLAQTAEHVATLIVDGARRDIPLVEGEPVLDAALRAGMDLPFACRGGMCSTCRAKLLEGTVRMEQNFSLEPWELQAGFVLTCQARPTSPRVVIDFDHV